MRPVYLILYFLCVIVASFAGFLAVGFIATRILQDFAGFPPPISRIGGVVTSDNAVFVGSWYGGRVYKFDFEGKLLKEFDNHGGPLWITQNGDRVVVNYSGRAWALDDPEFRVRDPGAVKAMVETTWWGHPMLVVKHADGTTSRAELQPWHVTVLRNPYPAGLAFPIAVVFLLTARHFRRRLRLMDNATERMVHIPGEGVSFTAICCARGGCLYRMDSIPIATDAVGYGDLFEAEDVGGELRVGRVVERGQFKKDIYIVSHAQRSSPDLERIRRAVESSGGVWEMSFGGIVAICLRADCDIDLEREFACLIASGGGDQT